MRMFKKLLKDTAIVTVATCVLLLLLELTLRPVAYFLHDRSDYYLYYGFLGLAGRVGVTPESTFDGRYYKFPPNYVLKGAAGQLSETASINSRGFRGPDFDAVKAPGVFRVICLGESSTFGYHDRDNETYPYLLQKLFDRDALHVEVINAGFPYYTSGSILSLLDSELLQYQPDLITLYNGFNDTGWPIHMGAAARAARWVQNHSITYVLLRETFGDRFGKAERKVLDQAFPITLRGEMLKENSDAVAARYRTNVETIIQHARSKGIPVVVIKQPVSAHECDYLSLSYDQENQRILERFQHGKNLSGIETLMLKQHRMMLELEKLATDQSLPLVDNVKIVDQDRRRLASWVHLTPEANQRLAEALEHAIKRYVPPTAAAQPTVQSAQPAAFSPRLP